MVKDTQKLYVKGKKYENKDKDKKKKLNSTDDDDGDDYYTSNSEDEDDEMDIQEYRKLLSNLFPSKYINKKLSAGNSLKKVLNDTVKKEDDDDEWVTDEEENENSNQIVTRSKTNKLIKQDDKSDNKKKDINKNKKEPNKKGRKVIQEEETEESDTEDDEEEQLSPSNKSNKVNIIFTIGGIDEDDDEDYYDDDDEDYDEDYETEDENESVSSEEEDNETPNKKNIVSTKKKENKSLKKEEESSEKNKKEPLHLITNTNTNTNANNNTNTNANNNVLQQLNKLLEENAADENSNELLKKCITLCETDIKKTKEKQEKKVKKTKDRNLRIFKKIINDKNVMNDFTFYEKLELEEQKKILKELRDINKITRIEKPYRMTLLESDIPTMFKGAAMKKINSLRHMDPGSGEFYKIKNWVDTFMRIPFGKHEQLNVDIDCGVDKCHEFMESAKKTLDDAVYGLNDAKMQIMQMLGQFITNPKSIGCAIAIHGPPGTGKTSLVKEGISKILNRPFAFIALGGATDSSFLEGHSYTYEGSTWGKIVQILIDSKCMNPVIYFDELDKISDTPKGEEIAGILTHLTDTSQNSQFHDKYFSEIDFDLSKCMFIFSYNDESKINPILKDRMYRIQTKGYNLKQKTIISNDYLLPKIRHQIKFNNEDIIIPEETLHYIIETHCNKENGVRNLKRCLEIVYTKLNLYRLMKPGTNLFEEDMSLKVEFPFKVTKDIVDKLIKTENNNISVMYSMYL
jgi:ATP-dependent Lon protease